MEYNTAVKITSSEQYSATWTNGRNDLSKKQIQNDTQVETDLKCIE